MNHKVLLADDSLTIQKVIKITLANQPYDITDCSSEEELFQKLTVVKPRIVFLDFNLSEKYSGYELTAKIKSAYPSTKVLLLLGTFDTVDDASMEKCGASDKIVKPFDSNKFIAICKQLISSDGDTGLAVESKPESKLETIFPSDDDLAMPDTSTQNPEDLWQMDNSAMKAEPVKHDEPAQEPLENKLDALSREMSDWGMSVPNIIDDKSSHDIKIDLPPVIAEVKSLDVQRQKAAAAEMKKAADALFPESGDLDYPTIEQMEASAAAPEETKKPKEKKSSQLVSLDIMNDKPMDLQLEGNYVEDMTDINSLEAQIRDEVEENLWQADEFEDLKREVSSKIEEMQDKLGPVSQNSFDDNLFRPVDDPQSVDWIDEETKPTFSAALHEVKAEESGPVAVDLSSLRVEIEAMVKKYVQEYMDQMFQKNVEKISWEVIPDLAENLIRQELGKIANKIMSDQE